jgi:hypothetical protein
VTYVDECAEIAKVAREAGFTVEGLLDKQLRWRPGIVIRASFSTRMALFASEHGYTAAPSGPRHTIIELDRK